MGVYAFAMILVVDDDVSFLELASNILNKDRQVFLAFDPQQAFQLAKHVGFSVALVDLDLKGKDGLSLIQKLRQTFPDLPIIAISSVLSGRRGSPTQTDHSRLEACCGTDSSNKKTLISRPSRRAYRISSSTSHPRAVMTPASLAMFVTWE